MDQAQQSTAGQLGGRWPGMRDQETSFRSVQEGGTVSYILLAAPAPSSRKRVGFPLLAAANCSVWRTGLGLLLSPPSYYTVCAFPLRVNNTWMRVTLLRCELRQLNRQAWG